MPADYALLGGAEDPHARSRSVDGHVGVAGLTKVVEKVVYVPGSGGGGGGGGGGGSESPFDRHRRGESHYIEDVVEQVHRFRHFIWNVISVRASKYGTVSTYWPSFLF